MLNPNLGSSDKPEVEIGVFSACAMKSMVKIG